MTTLIIARHGNTFGPEDTPTRVGGRTDIPLVEKGRWQAKAIGTYLKEHHLNPEIAYSATLKRTKETADLVLQSVEVTIPIETLDIFDEIDYGPDENQTEKTVIQRIGKEAIEQWDKNATVPDGWKVSPDKIIQNWHTFAHSICNIDRVVLVVTSNGIARFAPHITGDFDSFSQKHTIKLKTGTLGILTFSQGKWRVTDWNLVPILDENHTKHKKT